MRNGKVTIKGIKYTTFLMEMSRYGGMTKETALYLLRSAGVKVSTNRDYCYSPYSNCYAILVEESKVKKANRILYG